MKKKASRFISLVLCMSFLFTSFVVPAAQADSYTIVDVKNWDDTDTGAFANYNSVVDFGGEHGRVALLNVDENGGFKEATTAVLTGNSDVSTDARDQVFSADFYVPNNTLTVYLLNRYSDTATSHQSSVWFNMHGGITIRSTGGFVPTADNVENQGMVVQAYDPDVWHNITVYYDYAEGGDGKVYYFVDGEFATTTNLINKDLGVRKIVLGTYGGTGDMVAYVDNVDLHYIEDNSFRLSDLTKGDKAQNSCDLRIICEELGQTFWSKSVDFEIKIENTADTKKSYDVTTSLVSDMKQTEYAKTETIELEPNESKQIEVRADLSRYAVYDLNVTAVDKETGDESQLNTELVTIKKAEEQNPRHAIHDHAADSGDGAGRYPEKFTALKNAGMSGLRMSLWWETYEATPGVYELPEKFVEAYNTAKENDMDVLFINGFNNEKVNPGQWAPHTPEAIKNFAEYAHHLTLDTEEWAAGYEVWNEWNVLEHFNQEQLPASAYVDLIKPTYERIKAANPDAKVYGLSGMTWNRTDLYKQMAEEMFENGVHNYCDGFSIHTYKGYQSPDTRAHIEGVEYTQSLMDKYGVGDKELIITEMGWQAVNSSPDEVATWAVKYAAMIHDKVDRIYWYCSQRKIRNVGAGEQSYGWMQDENAFRDYVPYAPLPQMRAISNYNSYVATAEKLEEVELTESNGVAHKFKRKDGTNVTMTWIKDTAQIKEQAYAISVDVPTVSVSDIYGNETEYKTKDGKIYLTITNSPQYIVGSYNNISFEKTEFSLSTAELLTVANDESSFSLNKPSTLSGVKVEVEVPDDITVKENNGFIGDMAEIVFAIDSSPKSDAFAVVKVVDENSGAVYYQKELKLKLVNACAIEILPKKALDGRWKIGIKLNNEKRTSSISGSLEVKEPIFSGDKPIRFNFENIGAQSSITRFIYIPDNWSTARNVIKCEINLTSGDNFIVEDKVNLNGFARTSKAPKIDGVIKSGEWDKSMPFVLNKESNKPVEMATQWDGPEDLSAKFYYNWDRKNLYIAAEVLDNELCDSAENKTWQNDGIQVAFALSNEKDKPRTEIGFSLFGGEELMERTSWMALGAAGLGNIQDDYDFGDSEYKIRRDGNMTYYECKIPWEEVAYDGFNILQYEELYISILLNDNDGAGRRGWLEFCPGIGYVKNSLTFEKVKLFR